MLTILKHPNPILQTEAYEILHELVKRSALQDVLLSQSIAVLKLAVDPMGEEHSEGLDYWMKDPRSASEATANTLTQFGNNGDRNEDYAKLVLEASLAICQQQAHVAKLLGYFRPSYMFG